MAGQSAMRQVLIIAGGVIVAGFALALIGRIAR